MNKPKIAPNYSPEVRERAVRMIREQAGKRASRWAAIVLIAARSRCAPQALHNWVAQAERERGLRSDVTIDKREMVEALAADIAKGLRRAFQRLAGMALFLKGEEPLQI